MPITLKNTAKRLAIVLIPIVSSPAWPECLEGCGASSEQGRYHVVAMPDTQPVPMRTLHSWTLEVRNSRNEPVNGVSFAIDGGMPAHGHGLPSQPAVTDSLGEGKYRLDGVLFNMRGDWVLRVGIAGEAGRDIANIEIDLNY